MISLISSDFKLISRFEISLFPLDLNAGEPYCHGVIASNGRCSGSSSSFHRGCNIEDFLTYCLKIEKKTGQVTLSHAGSNSIYCYETISCKFARNILDLNKLRYIHISAGSQKVLIRNLVISFEQIADLHPSFDKNFKRGNDALPQNKKPHNRDRKPSPETTQPSGEKSPSILNKAINAVGSLFGYDADNKKLEPCPYASDCLLQGSPKHMKEYSHPSPSSAPSRNKDKESDLIRCRDGTDYRNTSPHHRAKYSHGKQVEKTKDNTYDTPHTSPAKASSEYQEKTSHDMGRNNQQAPCRHGVACRDQNDTHHCSKYSHPNEHGSNSSASSNHERTPCRHGQDCRDQNDTHHCSKYSHPHERGSKSSGSTRHERTSCRHGRDCRDKNDSHHCSKYSHPADDQRNQNDASSIHDKIPCKFGQKCHDTDPHHRSKYFHPNK